MKVWMPAMEIVEGPWLAYTKVFALEFLTFDFSLCMI